MNDEQLILHLTRKNAELEERVIYLNREVDNVTRYWLDSRNEVKTLKEEILSLQLGVEKEVANGGE